MRTLIRLLLLMTAMTLWAMPASAANGQIYTDPGGGEYWGKVYVASTNQGKSYESWTGQTEEAGMNAFRGFETTNNATATITDPSFTIKFRYHAAQGNSFKYNGSKQLFNLKMKDETIIKIGEISQGSWTLFQNNYQYGVLYLESHDDNWIIVRFVPNELCFKKVWEFHVENDTYYKRHKIAKSDGHITIHASYHKSVVCGIPEPKEPSIKWTAPGKIQLTIDNTWLPATMGNDVDNYKFTSKASVVVTKGQSVFARKEISVQGNASKTFDISVPPTSDFKVTTYRQTNIVFNYQGGTVYQDPCDSIQSELTFNNTPVTPKASFNQVTGEMRLQWNATDEVRKEGDYKIYRTALNDNGTFKGNRESIGSTGNNNFIDNQDKGLEYGNKYRYEVFQCKNSWGEVTLSSDPERTDIPTVSEVRASTMPIVPLHLVQDTTENENIKFNWDFGNIPNRENDITFKVNRIEPDGTVTHNYKEVTVSRTAGKASFTDDKPASTCTIYGYFLQLDLANNKVHLNSDTVRAHVLTGTTVRTLMATKGTSGNSVKLTWTTKQVGTDNTLFDIQRRYVGGTEWTTIHQVEGISSQYSYTDENVEVGRYYEYRVVAYGNDCEGGGRVINNAVTALGYGQATGVISGRVQYDDGSAVENVRINLSREGDEKVRSPFYSRHLMSDGNGIVWNTDEKTANNLLCLDHAFTIQAWVNPAAGSQSMGLFSIEGYNKYNFYLTPYTPEGSDTQGFVLAMGIADGIVGDNNQWFKDSDGKPGVILPDKFSQLTIRNNGNGQLDCIINGLTDDAISIKRDGLTTNDIQGTDDEVNVNFFGTIPATDNSSFKGYIDEVRLWGRALDNDEIATNYNRILNGREDGLKLYWTFDEGLEEYAFDNSCTDGVPNDNHPEIGHNSRPSDIVPDRESLSIYGITNDMGEYDIRGIPFTGSGTRYSVIPEKGTHDFNPTSRSAFISTSALTINNTDFTDVSSFTVRGTVRYAGTTIPVDSVSFYVDGKPCNKNDKLITTDENGEYEISVPIGEHYVEARRNGHSFVDGGRYPAGNGTYNFVSETNHDFSDNTLVVFAGRVVGGNTEADKPLGYGESKNNIGQAVIKISPLDHPQRMINAKDTIRGNTREWIPNSVQVEASSTTPDIKSTSYRAGGDIDEAKYVYIQTDPATGEFCAKIPPLRYKVESVKFPHNKEVENDEMFSSVPALDISNPLDTVTPDTIFSVTNEPLPLFKCNRKMMLTYRSQPVMEITQLGAKPGAFGSDTITVQDAIFNEHKLPIYNYNEDTGAVTYNYNHPIFEQGRTYEFKVKAYEPYTNYDSNPTGKLYEDALCDSIVTFDNELGAMARVAAIDTIAEGDEVKRGDMLQLEEGQVRLDSIGEGKYYWMAGMPSLTSPYTRSMNASMIINNQTKLWRLEGLEGVVAGTIPTGNNFITGGPDHVQMVLRDPPGDASCTQWGVDTITTNYKYTLGGVHNMTETGVTANLGVHTGLGTGTIAFFSYQHTDIIHDNEAHWAYTINKTWDNRSYVTYTHSHTIGTSTSPYYVGRDGDVFIGYSSNFIVGGADKVGLFEQPDSTWAIDMKEAICVGEKFDTHFEYSQKYIEGTLFDNLKRTREAKLTYISDTKLIVNDPPEVMYYTTLTEDDPRYGSANDDQAVWGDLAQAGSNGPSYYFRSPADYQGEDEILWTHNIEKAWKKYLADNEADKLNAFENRNKWIISNESFETGATATSGTTEAKHVQHNSTLDWSFTVAYKGKHGYKLNDMGCTFDFAFDLGGYGTEGTVNDSTMTSKIEYTLNDTQAGNAHTVDIFNSPIGWGPIFRTRGGQTRCPYEGETRTKYHEPGKLLDYATMKSDNPKIVMTTQRLTNIPAGQEAQLQVAFNNESETHDTYTVATVYIDPESNPNGLQVFMDGEPLVNGTELWMEYGIPLVKTLTIKQSDQSILKYDDIRLVLHSSCMALSPYDEKTFSVEFVPSAPPVKLSLNKTVFNKKAADGNDPVIATIKEINRLFNGLKGVRLKYRFIGDDQWITAHEWLTKSDYLPDGKEDDTHTMMPTDEPNINFTLDLPAIDGHYMVQAESFSIFGNKEVTNPTEEIEVVRDTRGPKLLGHAYPNTGFLRPTDDIFIRFNEDIRESYLTKDGNFFITGALNDAPINHEVSLQLNGVPLSTDATLPLYNTDFSTSFWLKRQSAGTILKHGSEGDYFAIGANEEGRMVVDIGNTSIESSATIPTDKWVFIGLNYYNGETPTVSAFVSEDAITTPLFDNITVPKHSSDAAVTIGENLHGAMSNLSIWKQTASQAEILENKNKNFPPYTPGLVGYWKMNEGHGTVVTDYARNRHFNLPSEMWNIDNTNYAAHFDGTHVLKSDISTFDTRATDSFMFELWFRGEKDSNRDATLMAVTDAFAVEFDKDGQLVLNTFDPTTMPSTTTSGTPHVLSSNDYNDGNWHHFALNVLRGVSAIAYVDGDAVKTIAEQDVPAPAGDFLHVGCRLVEQDGVEQDGKHFTGDIDELRLWSGAYDGTTIRNYRYSMVDTADASGLFAYYPMQLSHLDNAGNIITEFSALNKLNNRSERDVTTGLKAALTAPAIKSAPDMTNINFNYTASNDEIYIDLNELPSRLHGNLINFRVKNVRDVHDNLGENITWSAIANYNTLEWRTDKVEITKLRLFEAHASNTLYNISNEPVNFTLTDVPAWITISPMSGSIGVGESQLIDIAVSMGAPVGMHDVIVYAKNGEDIYTPYVISVNVLGNSPSWTVNASQYESTMNIVGQIYVNDKISSEKDTKIGAFVGEECRGVASPQYMASRDAYFVNLTVYGHEGVTTPEPITFRIYDASQGVVITDIVTTLADKSLDINFRPNDLVGTYNSPVAWHAGQVLDQSIGLKEGWNWISFYVNPFTPTLEGVFGHDRAFKNVTSKGDGFGECDGTQWQTSLSQVSPGNMYKVRVTKDVMAHATGSRIDVKTTPYTIYQGWNWIGSLSIYNLTLGEAFADLNPVAGDVVKSKKEVAMYNGFQWEGPLTALMPGEGYYYYSADTQDKDFHYPDIEGRQMAPAHRVPQRELGYNPADHHRFSDNMNVIAYMHQGEQPYTSETLAAFIDGECRGAVNASGNLYLLTIAGNADELGKPVALHTMIDGEDVVVDEGLTFLTDVVVGSLDEPYDINLGSSGINDLNATGARIVITPAITPDIVNVRCAAGVRSVQLFDATGRVLTHDKYVDSSDVTFDLSTYPYGIYFIEVISTNGVRKVQRVAHVMGATH
ncbi:MAG: hypothetical protein J6X70_03395 [Muribaculaceae bacterium]|nr:hypothetical protein [Muribaculaceae bacterium]